MTNPVNKLVNSKRICFIGDSITHGNKYMFGVYEKLLSNCDPHVRLYNCGIGGDTAGRALNRLDYDVLAFCPDTCVIMFGMNDCDRLLYTNPAAGNKTGG